MSEEQNPLPPVPEHTPPLKEDEVGPTPGKFFNQAWNRWFTSLRAKVNVINDTVTTLSNLVGNGLVVLSGGTATTVNLTDLVAGSNVSFDTSGNGRIIDNGSGPLTISATGGGGGGGKVLVAEIIVGTTSGYTTAVTNLDVTGLDLVADGPYFIELFWYSPGGATVDAYLFYNTEYTTTNYTITYAGPAAGTINTAWIINQFNGPGANGLYQTFIGTIQQLSGGHPSAQGNSLRSNNGNYETYMVSHRPAAGFPSPTTNVTSIRISCSAANGFDIGTSLRVWANP